MREKFLKMEDLYFRPGSMNFPNDKDNKDLKISLSLSYIEKPGQPDAFQLKDDDF